MQLGKYLLLQTVTLFKLLCQCGFIFTHPSVELLFRYIHIVNLYVEILSCREAVTFLLYFIVADGNREIIHSLLVLEGCNNLLYFLIAQTHFL